MKQKNLLCALLVAALLVMTCASSALAAPAPVPSFSAAASSNTCYTVQPGDNLFRISMRMGVSMYALMAANGLTNPNRVYAGQVLCMPSSAPIPPVYNPPVYNPPAPPSSCGFYYRVAYGDSLSMIAARFGANMYTIMAWNGISNPNLVYPGRTLCIPGVYRPPAPSAGNWRGEYFNTERLGGSPSIVRNDAAIDFNWGVGWPHPNINAEHFSVRWTRSLRLDTGTWRFTVKTDGGVRLFVDNVLVIDQWSDQPTAESTADVPLGTGFHTIRLEYSKVSRTAEVHLSWDHVADCNACLPGPSAPSGSWQGEYFDNINLGGSPDFTRADGAVDFNWGRESPAHGISKSFWSARWTITTFFSGGNFRFHAIVDDGVRVFVDGKVVIDEWEDNNGTTFIGDRYVGAGNHVVKVEYYQKAYDAFISVWWEKL